MFSYNVSFCLSSKAAALLVVLLVLGLCLTFAV